LTVLQLMKSLILGFILGFMMVFGVWWLETPNPPLVCFLLAVASIIYPLKVKIDELSTKIYEFDKDCGGILVDFLKCVEGKKDVDNQ